MNPPVEQHDVNPFPVRAHTKKPPARPYEKLRGLVKESRNLRAPAGVRAAHVLPSLSLPPPQRQVQDSLGRQRLSPVDGAIVSRLFRCPKDPTQLLVERVSHCGRKFCRTGASDV